MSKIEILSENSFKDKIKSDKPVLVDFFATWCGPCKMLGPILEDVSDEIADAEIVKIDIDSAMDLCKEYGIMSVPTMIIFKQGEIKEKMIGLRQKEQIIDALEEAKN